MFASTLVVALASLLASNSLESYSWHADYAAAQKLGREGHKPLAVFIGSGKGGWHQISQEGQLSENVKQLLAKHYISVYIDTESEEGKWLAASFEVPNRLGLIISDRSGRYQAFRHEGGLPSEQLSQHLSRYADPERVVQTTETNSPAQVSSYAAENYRPAAPSYSQPIRYASPGWSVSGRSC
jgi:hypothetical protein